LDNGTKRDLRVVKTLDVIHESFESLLLEKPFSKITVKALCDHARINKKTFYRYYPTLEDLRAELVSHYAEPYALRTKGLRYPQDLAVVTKTFLLYSAVQGVLYDAILCDCKHEELLDDIIQGMEYERYAISTHPQGWEKEEWNLYMAHVTSAQLLIYRQWVKGGRSVPIERMIEIGEALVCQGCQSIDIFN